MIKLAVRNIETALKKLYNIECHRHAEDFLIPEPLPEAKAMGDRYYRGALLIQKTDDTSADNHFAVGIYFNEPVRRELGAFPKWFLRTWSKSQLEAFMVATEEVSHFHCLLFHAGLGRAVSQLELEIQGEIDKFLMVYFARIFEQQDAVMEMDRLFDQLFLNFRLADGLSDEQQERYFHANTYAKRFITKTRRYFKNPLAAQKALPLFRHFYRLNLAEKLSLISKD